jgi:hypothetical protein
LVFLRGWWAWAPRMQGVCLMRDELDGNAKWFEDFLEYI